MSDGRTKPMPAVFVGHGNPMNAIENNEFHHGWQQLSGRIPRPESVLCISAHWETQGLFVTGSDEPETIHDFYGFPKSLYEVRYPAPGSPSLAHRTAALLAPEKVDLDSRRGLDHGAWGVLVAMYPRADIPVVQLSLDTAQPANIHYEVAKRLAPLRDEGVLILGSGNIVHNLKLFDFHNDEPVAWAVEFNEQVKELARTRRHEKLIHYEVLGADAKLAVPTREHFLPLLSVLALQREHESIQFHTDKVNSSISMTSLVVGG
ncbi:MAG: 4,5-DOPA dioxygenase extradiol [Gammaproteobacteria bacterium]|nr:4,5-DOPA dioxygenase extradiol [Gammaproteobacteria bacterium]MDH4313343.1 4,5-DOPA dioxygenase extradiol [Gammaproteobacteria bacterium]MDH5214012.1 4,5-DOPA dioxygenase extradiol [Gammaproteobacteria bacterium]MDH5501100.1 4,5-DOPA dioxygenase extradiol [Gammaproteobacteria bacterium]